MSDLEALQRRVDLQPGDFEASLRLVQHHERQGHPQAASYVAWRALRARVDTTTQPETTERLLRTLCHDGLDGTPRCVFCLTLPGLHRVATAPPGLCGDRLAWLVVRQPAELTWSLEAVGLAGQLRTLPHRLGGPVTPFTQAQSADFALRDRRLNKTHLTDVHGRRSAPLDATALLSVSPEVDDRSPWIVAVAPGRMEALAQEPELGAYVTVGSWRLSAGAEGRIWGLGASSDVGVVVQNDRAGLLVFDAFGAEQPLHQNRDAMMLSSQTRLTPNGHRAVRISSGAERQLVVYDVLADRYEAREIGIDAPWMWSMDPAGERVVLVAEDGHVELHDLRVGDCKRWILDEVPLDVNPSHGTPWLELTYPDRLELWL